MRTHLLMLIATISLVGCTAVKPAATTPATAVAPEVVGSAQNAVWIHRKAHVVATGISSCNALYNVVKWALLRLGARASDLDVRQPANECHQGGYYQVAVEANFSVLAPIDDKLIAQLQERFGQKDTASAVVEAHWQTVDLVPPGQSLSGGYAAGSHITGGGMGSAVDNCYLPKVVRDQIVPLFFTKDAKLISCNLRVQELTAAPLPGAQYLLRLEREKE